MKTISALISSSIFSVLTLSLPVQAQEQPQTYSLKPVAELYSSQSCGKCPKGNERFGKFIGENDVVGLTFGVDYWDYMGWKDTFAKPEFGERQTSLNRAMDRRGPYTPQVIFNGKDHCTALKEKNMKKQLIRADEASDNISIQYDGSKLSVVQSSASKIEVLRAEYIAGKSYTTPERGQNENMPMTYYNVVTQLASLGIYDTETRNALSASCSGNCAFIVQDGNTGTVLGAFSYTAPASN